MSPDENSLLNSPKSAQHLKDSRLSKDETNDIRKERTHFQSLYSLIYCICACDICLQLSAFVSDPSNISGVFFNTIGCILYIIDVVTDTLTGLFYISGQNMDSYKFGNRNILFKLRCKSYRFVFDFDFPTIIHNYCHYIFHWVLTK